MYAELLGIYREKGKLPEHLTFSLAALMAFYTGTEIRDKALIGHRNGQEYNIIDDTAVLEFFAANSSKDAREYAHAVLSNEAFWEQDSEHSCRSGGCSCFLYRRDPHTWNA